MICKKKRILSMKSGNNFLKFMMEKNPLKKLIVPDIYPRPQDIIYLKIL